jgi:ankyrin repeat protein
MFVGNTPLHLAALDDQDDNALVLIKSGADPEMLNEEGSTPLQLASPHLRQLLTDATSAS